VGRAARFFFCFNNLTKGRIFLLACCSVTTSWKGLREDYAHREKPGNWSSKCQLPVKEFQSVSIGQMLLDFHAHRVSILSSHLKWQPEGQGHLLWLESQQLSHSISLSQQIIVSRVKFSAVLLVPFVFQIKNRVQ